VVFVRTQNLRSSTGSSGVGACRETAAPVLRGATRSRVTPAASLAPSLSAGDLSSPIGAIGRTTASRVVSGTDLVITDAAEQLLASAASRAQVFRMVIRHSRYRSSPISSKVIVNSAGGDDTITVDLSAVASKRPLLITAARERRLVIRGEPGNVAYNHSRREYGSVVMSNFGPSTTRHRSDHQLGFGNQSHRQPAAGPNTDYRRRRISGNGLSASAANFRDDGVRQSGRFAHYQSRLAETPLKSRSTGFERELNDWHFLPPLRRSPRLAGELGGE